MSVLLLYISHIRSIHNKTILMRQNSPDPTRPTPEAIAQHQECMHQKRELKRLEDLTDYSLQKWEITREHHKKVIEAIHREFDRIMNEVQSIRKF